MQEKLAKAILKESQDSSEPELSDTSTEDEEDVRKGPEQGCKGTKGGDIISHNWSILCNVCRLKCSNRVCRGTCDRNGTGDKM